MDAFSHKLDKKNKLMKLKLVKGFCEDDWKDLIDFYKEQVERGVLHWELDLTDLDFISSNSIGMLVAFNTSLAAYTGKLQVILPDQSPVTNQFRFAKLDQILTAVFV